MHTDVLLDCQISIYVILKHHYAVLWRRRIVNRNGGLYCKKWPMEFAKHHKLSEPPCMPVLHRLLGSRAGLATLQPAGWECAAALVLFMGAHMSLPPYKHKIDLESSQNIRDPRLSFNDHKSQRYVAGNSL